MSSKRMSKKRRALLSSTVALCLVSCCFAFFALISEVPQNAVSALGDSVQQSTQGSSNETKNEQAKEESVESQSSGEDKKIESTSTQESNDDTKSEEVATEQSVSSSDSKAESGKTQSGKTQEKSSKTSESKTDTNKDASSSTDEQKSEDTKEDSNEITITVEVTGSGYADVSGGGTFTLDKGSNAYDALKACGLNINASTTQYGIYVSAIEGLAEKEHGPTSGWLYSVNGVTPGTACSNYKLSDGDVVKWFYVA